MAVTACVTDQFKQDILSGLIQTSDTFKIALFLAANSTLGPTTTTYSTTGELATSNGYTQGGQTIATYTVGLSSNTAYVTFTTNPSWTATGAGFTADTAVIYDSTRSNHIVCILSFGSTTASGGGTFTVQLPAAGASATVTIT
jgi:hypothetical protein